MKKIQETLLILLFLLLFLHGTLLHDANKEKATKATKEKASKGGKATKATKAPKGGKEKATKATEAPKTTATNCNSMYIFELLIVEMGFFVSYTNELKDRRSHCMAGVTAIRKCAHQFFLSFLFLETSLYIVFYVLIYYRIKS